MKLDKQQLESMKDEAFKKRFLDEAPSHLCNICNKEMQTVPGGEAHHSECYEKLSPRQRKLL